MELDIEKLEQAALAATQGEWDTDGFVSVGASRNDQVNGGFFICHCEGTDKSANANFIAQANPSAVLELITRLESAEKDTARLDWLSNNSLSRPRGMWQWSITSVIPYFRESIDAAIREMAKEKQNATEQN